MSKPRQPRRRCLHIREKKGIRAKKGVGTPPALEKNEVGLKKRLANLWNRTKVSKITKEAPRRSWARNQMGNPE
jgi:hypothetical protein